MSPSAERHEAYTARTQPKGCGYSLRSVERAVEHITMLLLKPFIKLFRLLNSKKAAHEIAWGVAFGLLLGLTPGNFVLKFVVLFLILLFEVNYAACIVSAAVFALFAYLLDPVFHALGWFLLAEVESLGPMWTTLYNTPVVPWTRFNNTVVLGSLIISLALLYPVYRLSLAGINYYRTVFAERIKRIGVLKALKLQKVWNFVKIFVPHGR